MQTDGNEGVEELRCVLKKVRDESDADIILFGGTIDRDAEYKLCDLVTTCQSRQNVILYMTTPGGEPDAAYKIARRLQNAYSDGWFALWVDTLCKSAGSLIALGADRLIMSEVSELGPLDIQLSKPDALAENTSGLTPKKALTTLHERAFETLEETFYDLRLRSNLQITTRTALDVATRFATGLFSPIYQQMDPMRLGEITRAMAIVEKYGNRIARSNVREGTLRRLIEDYPSHSFVIDRDEARELFVEVAEPTSAQYDLSEFLKLGAEKGMRQREAVVEFISVLADEVKKEKQDDIETTSEESTNDSGSIPSVTGNPSEETATSDEQEVGTSSENRMHSAEDRDSD